MKRLSLSARLLMAVIFPLIAVFLFLGVILDFGLTRGMESAAKDIVLESIETGAEEVTQSLEELESWLRNLSRFPEMRKGLSSSEVSVWLQDRYLDEPTIFGYSYAKIADKDFVIDNKTHKIKEVKLKDRAYYKAVLTNKTTKFYISKPLLSRARNKWIVVLSHAVENLQNEVDSMLSLAVDIERLVDLVIGKNITKENATKQHIWVIDKEGRFISDNQELAKNQAKIDAIDDIGFGGLKALSQNILSEEKGYARLPKAKKIVSWTTIENTPGWKFGKFLSVDEVDDVIHSLLFFLFVIMLVSIILLTLIFFYIIKKQMNPISKSLELAKNIAELDLTHEIDEKTLRSKDELGDLAKAMNKMTILLRQMIHDIRLSGNYVNSSSEELSTTSQIISQGSSQQAATLEEVAASVVEMEAMIKENAENALNTEKIADRSSQMAEDSGKAVLQTVSSMNQIAEKVSIIQKIAGQTRLLALNAGIEAARAGNSGRGFAVVAQEVSKLAELSSSAASQIEELTASSVEIANNAGDKLKALLPEIQKTANLVAQITSSSKEQEVSVGQINISVQEVNGVAQNNAGFSDKLADTAANSAKYAEQLRSVISRFKI